MCDVVRIDPFTYDSTTIFGFVTACITIKSIKLHFHITILYSFISPFTMVVHIIFTMCALTSANCGLKFSYQVSTTSLSLEIWRGPVLRGPKSMVL